MPDLPSVLDYDGLVAEELRKISRGFASPVIDIVGVIRMHLADLRSRNGANGVSVSQFLWPADAGLPHRNCWGLYKGGVIVTCYCRADGRVELLHAGTYTIERKPPPPRMIARFDRLPAPITFPDAT